MRRRESTRRLILSAVWRVANTPEAEISGCDFCCGTGLRSKNDLWVKEIVNPWAGKLRGSEVNAGQMLE
jgi:hypothetical protein